MNGAAELDAARAAWVLTGELTPLSVGTEGLAGALRTIVASETFEARTLWALREGDLEGRLLGERLGVVGLWTADTFPLTADGRHRSRLAATRGVLLPVLLADAEFCNVVSSAASPNVRAALAGAARRAQRTPRAIALLGIVRNESPEMINDFLASVLDQDECDWELCICDCGSASWETRYALERLRGVDARIRLTAVAGSAPLAVAVARAALLARALWAWKIDLAVPLAPGACQAALARISAEPTEPDRVGLRPILRAALLET